MDNKREISIKEKKSVALFSVLAAIFITIFKLIVGLLTRSLGIISEALHSALDLIAALITYFSVKVSDKPPDLHHNYGHGKIENLSALIETLLLFITCIWIIYEAVYRLSTGFAHFEVNVWSFIVIITSIIIDISRSRALSKAAKKHNSAALEADALHFSTDIWSSSVVLLGLILSSFGFHIADAIAALGVAAIVIVISYRLGKKSIDVLLDRAPKGRIEEVKKVINELSDVTYFHDIKIRMAGADTFVELNIHVDPNLSIMEAHDISDRVEQEIKAKIDRCEVHVHAEPEPELEKIERGNERKS